MPCNCPRASRSPAGGAACGEAAAPNTMLGHRPSEYLAVVRTFLAGQELPIPASAAGPAPKDYEGPE